MIFLTLIPSRYEWKGSLRPNAILRQRSPKEIDHQPAQFPSTDHQQGRYQKFGRHHRQELGLNKRIFCFKCQLFRSCCQCGWIGVFNKQIIINHQFSSLFISLSIFWKQPQKQSLRAFQSQKSQSIVKLVRCKNQIHVPHEWTLWISTI